MFRIVAMLFGWKCGIRFRDFEDARRYARRNGLTRDFFGGHSRFVIVKVDESGCENHCDRWEI